jgi:CRP/FNR family transcriptional regulator, cyclic AMP receptor protein
MTKPHASKPSALGLRGIHLLDGLSDARLEALAEICAWRSYNAGQQIISRNASDREVYWVVAGKVRINIFSAAGRQVTFRDLLPGDMFGDIAAIDGGQRSTDGVALESVLLASLSAANFKLLLREEPIVDDRFRRRLAELIRLLTDRVIELSTMSVQNRIHAELVRLARVAGVHGNAARISPAPKHGDIASQVSTTREQVTRELSALASAGIVSKAADALVVVDVSKLKAMVQLFDSPMPESGLG